MALPTVLIVTGAFVLSFGFLFGFVGFRQIINYKISKNVALLPNSEMRKAWEKVPIPIDFKIYIFNVTNPEQVHNGSKPILQEVGPYFYDEWKEKVKVVDNRTEDTVSFHMKTRWNFNAKRSESLTGDEIITIPHIAILGMVMMVEIQKPPMLTIVNRAIPHIYGNPQTIFVTATAKELLFEGIVMNCTSKEFAPAAICTAIKQNAKSLHRVSEDIFKFSLFGVKNNTPDEGRFTVNRGVQNYKEVGQVMLFNGEKELKIWSGPKCNALRGTDSTIFAPFIQPGEEIVSFAPDLCRSLGAKYRGPVTYKGIPGYHYTADLGDMSSNEDEKCYCPTPTTCHKKGLFDLTKCTGAPIILTLPHFYETDPSYLDQIVGLKPEKEKHMIYMNFEPITGTPLGARKRLQFNMFIHSVKKIDIMKNVPNALMPLFWVEEGLELDQDFIDLLDGSLFRALRIVGVGRWLAILIGGCLIGGGVYVHYRRKKLFPVQQMEPREDGSSSRPVSSVKVADVESVNRKTNLANAEEYVRRGFEAHPLDAIKHLRWIPAYMYENTLVSEMRTTSSEEHISAESMFGKRYKHKTNYR